MTFYAITKYFCSSNNIIHVEECKKNPENPENPVEQENPENSGKFFGSAIDGFMIRIFTKIATFAALSPWVTLIAMLSIAGVLCAGITQLR